MAENTKKAVRNNDISKIEVGKTYEGTVTNIVKFGAFVRLNEFNVEGLLHISKIADAYVSNVNDYLAVEQAIEVEVINIEDNKVSLKLVK